MCRLHSSVRGRTADIDCAHLPVGVRSCMVLASVQHLGQTGLVGSKAEHPPDAPIHTSS